MMKKSLCCFFVMSVCSVLSGLPAYADGAKAQEKPAYINYDEGIVRDPYAEPPVDQPVDFDSVQAAMDMLSDAKTFEGKVIGIGHRLSTVFAAQQFIAANGSQKQLVSLLDHQNPVARCYAILAMATTSSAKVLAKHVDAIIKDDEKFSTLHYDMASYSTPGDCVVEHWFDILPEDVKTRLTGQLLKFTGQSKARDYILLNWTISDAYYQAVKNSFLARNQMALIALARYRKKADLPHIEQALKHNKVMGLRAIAQFPDERFIPKLTKMLKAALDESYSNSIGNILSALMAFDEAQVMPILQSYVFADKKKVSSSVFYALEQALSSLPNDRYMTLKFQLLKDWHQTTPDLLTQLVQFDSKKTTDIVVELLTQKQALDGQMSYELPLIYVFKDLLALVETHRKSYLTDVLINSTARSDINTFGIIAPLLIKHHPAEAPYVLLYLIKEVRQPSFLVSVLATLETMDPTRIDLKMINENPIMKPPWANWEDENCFNMINYHIKGQPLRDRLKLQCTPGKTTF